MKTTITVESFESLAARKLDRAKRLNAGEPVTPERRITFDRPEDLLSFLTGSRVRVLEAAIQRPRSVTELASALNRTRSAVSRDVRALQDCGMVIVKRETNPGHGQVSIVRASAKRFDLLAKITA